VADARFRAAVLSPRCRKTVPHLPAYLQQTNILSTSAARGTMMCGFFVDKLV
jgi:hypothetical protein